MKIKSANGGKKYELQFNRSFLRELLQSSSGKKFLFQRSDETDIKDEGDHYQLAIDLPSIKKEDIKLALDDGYLTVSASFNREDKENNGKYLHRERHYGNYSRSFYVGDQVKEEDIKAKLDEGVLRLSIRKTEEKEADSKKFISIE